MVRIIVLVSTILWAAVALLAPMGYWFVALLLLIVLLVAHAALGTSRSEKLDVPLLTRVVAPWAGLWALAFALAELFASRSVGERPAFTIGGLHPSFAVLVLLYWVGATIAITWAFYASRDRWLSAERWESFRASIGEEEGEP